jgi:hypothetical protein
MFLVCGRLMSEIALLFADSVDSEVAARSAGVNYNEE